MIPCSLPFLLLLLPDMLTFSPVGRFLLVVNEGEPDEDSGTDQVGSVSITDFSAGYRKALSQRGSYSYGLASKHHPRPNHALKLS